jgi:hypothetical protein
MGENVGIVGEMDGGGWTRDEGRWTRDDKISNKIRTIRDLKIYRKGILSSLFLVQRSSIVPRFF